MGTPQGAWPLSLDSATLVKAAAALLVTAATASASAPPATGGIGGQQSSASSLPADALVAALSTALGSVGQSSLRSRSRSRSPGHGGYGYGDQSRYEPLATTPIPASSVEQEGITDRRFEGTIVSIDPERGFGFIECDELKRDRFGNKDIFLHRAQVGGFCAGDRVSFGVLLYKDGKPQAKDLRPAGLSLSPTGLGGMPLQGEDVVRELDVPADLAGALVGKAGSCIMDLQRRAGGGCHIQILQPKFPGGPQVGQVVGPAVNANYAYELMKGKLEEIKQARRHFDIVRGVVKPSPDDVPDAGRELLEAAMNAPSPSPAVADAEWVKANPAMALECLMLEKATEPGSGMNCGMRDDNGDVLHELELPTDLIGAFVGKQGSCITDLQIRAGGARVQVQPPKVAGGVQIATIQGPVINANLGLLMARQKLDELRDARQSYDEMRASTSGGTITDGLGGGPHRDSMAPAPVELNGEACRDIEVPADLIGALVGKQGSSVMELQRRAGTGVHIQIQQPAYRGAHQVATITGSSSGVAYGSQLLLDRLDEIKQQRSLYDADRAARAVRATGALPQGPSPASLRGAPQYQKRHPTPAPPLNPQAVLSSVLQTLLPALQGAGRPAY